MTRNDTLHPQTRIQLFSTYAYFVISEPDSFLSPAAMAQHQDQVDELLARVFQQAPRSLHYTFALNGRLHGTLPSQHKTRRAYK